MALVCNNGLLTSSSVLRGRGRGGGCYENYLYGIINHNSLFAQISVRNYNTMNIITKGTLAVPPPPTILPLNEG